MLQEMTKTEVARLISATNSATYIQSQGETANFLINKALNSLSDTRCTGMYLLNLGRVIERIEKSFGEENENLLDINLDDIAAIIDNVKGGPPIKISEALFDYLFVIQKEAFRYGYYAALKAEVL